MNPVAPLDQSAVATATAPPRPPVTSRDELLEACGKLLHRMTVCGPGSALPLDVGRGWSLAILALRESAEYRDFLTVYHRAKALQAPGNASGCYPNNRFEVGLQSQPGKKPTR